MKSINGQKHHPPLVKNKNHPPQPHYNCLTVLRLQLSASGSKRKLDSLVKAQSKTSVKVIKVMSVVHMSHVVDP
eukprot:scaffold4052_cov213-Amphora_coffeaeformis.AAC.15